MSTSAPRTEKKGKGRQKIAIVKIANDTNRQVTFSKRRAGVFKKASEICELCDAEAALVVFSPGNKAHSFGHPSVNAVSRKFLNIEGAPLDPATRDAEILMKAHHKRNVQHHTAELGHLERQLEMEQKRAAELDRAVKEARAQGWFPPPINEMSYEQLQQLKSKLLTFKEQVEERVRSTAPPTGDANYVLENPSVNTSEQAGGVMNYDNIIRRVIDDTGINDIEVYDPMAADNQGLMLPWTPGEGSSSGGYLNHSFSG